MLASKLEGVANGTVKKLAVFMPPRHGKSEECSIQFPAWILGKKPKTKIIMASYSQELATDFGRKARNLVNTQEYRNVFNINLAQDSKSAGRWNTDAGGYYVSTGIGGAATGKGADCLVAGTMVNTDKGIIPIESVQYGERVLSYSHETNTVERDRVLAVRTIPKRETISITTLRGSRITCTPEHRFYVIGQGYIEAQKLKEGYEVCTIKNESCPLLCDVSKKIHKRMGGIHQRSKKREKGFLLFSRMFPITSFIQELKALSMWLFSNKKWEEVLWKMQAITSTFVANQMLYVPQGGATTFSSNKVLQYGLQEQTPQSKSSRKEKPKLEAWLVSRHIPEGFLQDEKYNIEKRWKQVCDMFTDGQFNYSPQEQKPKDKHETKSDNGMCNLSCTSSQVKTDTVSSIEWSEEIETVYDIQVENNKNFFANGILVHNCLIIDDPHKNRKDADSPVKRKEVIEWYRSTAKTRLSPEGAVILILTRWHDSDLAGSIVDNTWDIVEFKAIAEEDDQYRKKGEALWASKFTVDWLLNQKKDIGSFEFSALYQQAPLDVENAEFKSKAFLYRTKEEVLGLHTERFLTIDTAVSKSTSSDYTGLVDNYVDTDQVWNISATHVRIDAGELINLIFEKHKAMGYTRIGIEETIFYQAIQPFLVEEQRKRNIYLPIYPLKHNQVAKEIRIRGLLPRYEAGMIYHIRGHCDELEQELIRFPKSSHDDINDALAYQSQLVTHVTKPQTYEQDFRSSMRVDPRTGYPI